MYSDYLLSAPTIHSPRCSFEEFSSADGQFVYHRIRIYLARMLQLHSSSFTPSSTCSLARPAKSISQLIHTKCTVTRIEYILRQISRDGGNDALQPARATCRHEHGPRPTTVLAISITARSHVRAASLIWSARCIDDSQVLEPRAHGTSSAFVLAAGEPKRLDSVGVASESSSSSSSSS